MIFGLDHLGIAKYGDLAAAEHPAGWALGTLARTFGDDLPAVKKTLDTGRCVRWRRHIYWSTNPGHKPDKNYLSIIDKEAKRYAEFIKPYLGKVDLRISGYLEHPLKRAEAEKVRQVVLNRVSGVTYVNSFVASLGGQTLSGAVNEIHGGKAAIPGGRFDYSTDGESCFDVDIESQKRKLGAAETFYFWFPQQNGKKKVDEKSDPAKRKAWPVSRHIDSAIYLHRASGVSGKLPKGYTLKTHADQHTDKPSGKDCTLLLICPPQKAKVQIVTRNGQVVDTLEYLGAFEGGGFRYYSYDWGYLLAEKARRIQGDSICDLKINGKVVGKINPAFRAGTFR